MQELKINKTFRDQLPPLPADKYQKLEKDITTLGCFDPIRIWRGFIIDGHHRYKICQEHGIEFKTMFLDECFEDENDVRIWIIDHQDGRRELEDYVRCELQIEKEHLIENKQGQRSDLTSVRQRTDVDKPSRESAKEAGVGKTTYFEAKYIAQNAPEETKQKLRRGDVTIKSEYKKLKQAEKRKDISFHIEELAKQDIAIAKRLYDVIAIDPPWDLGGAFAPSDKTGHLPLAYPTMSVEEIEQLELPCAKDCHIFLWTTQKFLKYAFNILDAWDLDYACTFTWAKNGGPQVMGLPQYNTEFFLYARKGNPKFVDTKNFNTLLTAKRTGHSEKPEEFYDLLRRVTVGRRLDMFNRRNIEGFDGWGNEAVS